MDVRRSVRHRRGTAPGASTSPFPIRPRVRVRSRRAAAHRMVSVVAGLSAGVAIHAEAMDISELYISGFVSQGYVNTSENDFRLPNATEGTFDFNEAAIAVSVMPSPRFRVGIQFTARDFGDNGNNQVMLDWGYGDFRWRDELGIRAGKVKVTWGLFNHLRDLDFARTSIFLPHSVYNEDLRDFALAVQGASIYGNACGGETGNLDYEVYAGAYNVPDPDQGLWNTEWRYAGQQIAAAFEGMDGIAGARFGGVLEPSVHFPWAIGGSLFWNTPVVGLRVGTSWIRTEAEGSARLIFDLELENDDGTIDQTRTDVVTRFESHVDQLAVHSIEYVHGRLALSAEYYREVIGYPASDGWYAMVGYELTDWLTLGGYRAVSHRNIHDRDGTKSATEEEPAEAWYLKDWTATARVDILDNWLVKLEYHRMHGLGFLERALAGEGDADWDILAVKSTVHF